MVDKPRDTVPKEILDDMLGQGIERGDIQFCWDVANHATDEATKTMIRVWETAVVARPDMAGIFTAMTLKMMEATMAHNQQQMLEIIERVHGKDKPKPTGSQSMAQWKADLAKYGVTF